MITRRLRHADISVVETLDAELHTGTAKWNRVEDSVHRALGHRHACQQTLMQNKVDDSRWSRSRWLVFRLTAHELRKTSNDCPDETQLLVKDGTNVVSRNLVAALLSFSLACIGNSNEVDHRTYVISSEHFLFEDVVSNL